MVSEKNGNNIVLHIIDDAVVCLDVSIIYTTAVKAARANGTTRRPDHDLVTDYRYNSLNQVLAQHMPYAGTSKFWYDRLGRLAISQQAQQSIDGRYSYTFYDPLGRITEVGEKPQAAVMTQNTVYGPHVEKRKSAQPCQLQLYQTALERSLPL